MLSKFAAEDKPYSPQDLVDLRHDGNLRLAIRGGAVSHLAHETANGCPRFGFKSTKPFGCGLQRPNHF